MDVWKKWYGTATESIDGLGATWKRLWPGGGWQVTATGFEDGKAFK
jgi:hypothetical protein